MGRLMRQGRSWDEGHVSGLYPQQQQAPFLMAMQQSNSNNNHSPFSLLESSSATRPQVSASEPSSSVAESRVGSQFEGIPPPFIDFLGVGAT